MSTSNKGRWAHLSVKLYILHFALSLAQKLEKPYPLRHTLGVQNPTLTGTLLENLTLCGTEIGQNGTLAVLAYACCRQWECPPGFLGVVANRKNDILDRVCDGYDWLHFVCEFG